MTLTRFIQSIFTICAALFLISCEPGSTEEGVITVPQKDAQITGFSVKGSFNTFIEDSLMRAEDSIRMSILEKTKFAIDQVNGIIYNPTPIAAGTKFNKLLASISTRSASFVRITSADTTVVWSENDSVDFSKPVQIEVAARDSTSKKIYTLKLRTYEYDQDSIRWKKEQNLPSSAENHKVVLNTSNDKFYNFSNTTGGTVSVAISNRNSVSWTNTTASGLPINIDVTSITILNSQFFAVSADNKVWTSTDGLSWTALSANYDVAAIYGILPTSTESTDYLLVAIKDGGIHYFGKTNDMITIEKLRVVDYDFPLKNFSATNHFNRLGANNVLMITGGMKSDSIASNKTWIIENTASGIVHNSFANNSLFSGSGIGFGVYNGGFLALQHKQLFTGKDWGNYWYKVSYKQDLPKEAIAIKEQNMITDNENYIWFFGGIDSLGISVTEVWRGRLNSLDPALNQYKE